MEKQEYSKRLTPSEIKYHYLKIEKPFCDLCPKPSEKIVVNGIILKMHSSQSGRIDRMTDIYRNENAKIGDNASIFFKSGNEITISFGNGEDIFALENKILHEQTSLSKILERIRELCKTKTYLFCYNETNVRIELIEPVLGILGWRIPDLTREIKCSKTRRKADFALFKEGRCVFVIEAKSIDKPLNQKAFDKNEIQLKNYLTDPRFINAKYGILTNGQVWQIRDKNSQNIIKSIDILADGKENEIEAEINDFFDFLKKDNDFDDPKNVLKPETRPHYEANDRTAAFRITRFGKPDIQGKDPTTTFRIFLEENRDEIKTLQDKNRFVVKVLSENEIDLRNPKKGEGQLGGKTYYTTGDHSTYLKRMIVQQIIDELHLDAEIKNID